jgi:hypothetical protein
LPRYKLRFAPFFVAHLAVEVYIPNSDDFLTFEPDVKALGCARRLWDTDGDGV